MLGILFLYGFTTLVTAGMLAIWSSKLLLPMIDITGIVMILRGCAYLIPVLLHRRRAVVTSVVLCSLEITVGVAMIALRMYSMPMLYTIEWLYLSFIAGLKIVNVLIAFHNHSRRVGPIMEAAALVTVLGLMLFFPASRIYLLSLAAGFTITVFGLISILDLLRLVIKSPNARRRIQRLRLLLPGYLSTFLPMRLLERTREMKLEREKDRQENAEEPELEVLFQLGGNGISVAGHCEICYHGRTLTYGNYDAPSQKVLKTVGNGIVFRADRQSYMDWVTENHGKMFVGFGIRLNRSTRRQVEQRIAALQHQMEPWSAVRAMEIMGEKGKTTALAYAEKLERDINAELFRVTTGKYRTYFIPNINCVSMTCYIIEAALESEVTLYGIHTPGGFLDYLQHEYIHGAGAVVSRRVYPLKAAEKQIEQIS